MAVAVVQVHPDVVVPAVVAAVTMTAVRRAAAPHPAAAAAAVAAADRALPVMTAAPAATGIPEARSRTHLMTTTTVVSTALRTVSTKHRNAQCDGSVAAAELG
jgi:hypothetical protein